MIPAKKFLFDYSFDAVDLSPEPTGQVRASTEKSATNRETEVAFSAEDLAEARAQGFAAGHEQASREAALTIENRVAEALKTLGDHLAALLSRHANTASRAAADATTVAVAVARKIVPDLYRRNAIGEIEFAIAKILDRMGERSNLHVRVSETLGDGLAPRVRALAERLGLAGQVTVTTDPLLDEGDCRVEWARGGAELNMSALGRELDVIADRNAGDIAAVGAGNPNPKDSQDSDAVADASMTASGDPTCSHLKLEPEHG